MVDPRKVTFIYQVGKEMRYKQLRTSQGYIIQNTQDLLQETVQFYRKLYTQAPVSCNVAAISDRFLSYIPMENMTYSYFRELDKLVTVSELYDSLSNMKPDKASDPDGLSVEFYRAFWPYISDIVHGALMQAKVKGQMSDSQRRGILQLLPKKNKDLMYVRNWRPITLLNVDYKLLSKSLATRLRAVLPDLVYQDQRGFIKDRYIGDNIMEIYSLIARAEQQDKEAILILLDIQKAFDSVSWAFLKKVLDTYMFPDSFIEWIDVLYRNKEIRIINNGHVSTYIKPTRGLAQGDGLSPLLFVFVIETLALSIRQNQDIQGITCGNIHKKISMLAVL